MNAPYSLRWVTFSTHSHGTYASGYVYDNPKFVDGYFIDTSYIQSMTLEGAALTLQTRNSRYVCALDELCGDAEDTQQVMDLLTSFLPDEQATLAGLTLVTSPPEQPSTDLTEEAFHGLCQQLEGLADLPPNCFILCLDLRRSCDYLFSGFFKKQADSTVEVVLKKPLVHLGMFQDSVLCMDDTDGAFDLRYFPYTDGISFYRPVWDMPPEEEPQQVYYLCNVGERPLNIDDIPLPHMACYKVPAGKHGGQ